MPADTPLVGETWETVDAATGQAAQAVVTEASSQVVRLHARFGRTLVMPLRSFRMTWHFVQEAPARVCAHAQCNESAYFQVNDLGTWVWVCPKHLPAHVMPLLPTDAPGDPSTNCPTCNSSAAGATGREVGIFTVRLCPKCDSYWAYLVGEGDPNSKEECFEDGLRLGEGIQDLVAHFETDGLRARGIVGALAWEALRMVAPVSVVTIRNPGQDTETRTSEPGRLQFAGVELAMSTTLGNAVAVIGERPRGVQRLGGAPRVATQDPEALPEVGSAWADEAGLRVKVSFVGLSTQDTRRGRRLVVAASAEDGSTEVAREFPLADFLRYYRPAPQGAPPEAPIDEDAPKTGSTWWEKRTYRKIFIQKRVVLQGQSLVQTNQGSLIPVKDFLDKHTEQAPEPPCKVGEEWEDKNGGHPFTIEKTLETTALVRYAEGGPPREIPFYILATRYKKYARRTALQRITEDD